MSSSKPSSVSSSSSSVTSSIVSGCGGLPVWSSSTVYANKGTLVAHNSVKYENKWWTQNNDPATNSGTDGVWINKGACVTSSSSVSSSVSSSSLSSSKSSSSSSVGNATRRYVTYASTWNTSIYDLTTANIPNYITNVNLSFVRPDTTYQKGSYAFDQGVAGFEFVEGAMTNNGQKTFTAQQATDLRNAITALRNRGTQVWISVGGWSYSQGDQWSHFNAPRVVALAQDLGASGVDIDWESSTSICNKGDSASFSCTKDAEVGNIISSLHSEIQARNAGLGISIAGWSTGAYYVKGTAFEEGKVQWGSPFGGTMYNLVKNHGSKLTFINLMSYDAGDYFDARECYESYRAIYNGPLNMGMEIAPEGAGGAVLEVNAPSGTVYDADMMNGQNNMAVQYYNVETMVKYIKNKGRSNDGFMMWQLWKQRVHMPAPAGAATENAAGQYVCRNLPLAGDCNQTIPALPKL
ncbi:MAG: carbohydrate-binding protein [Moraxellaceae bacterium]|nr:MAG: carbohydrate-binding protein [Moraxellaceae bacterium]